MEEAQHKRLYIIPFISHSEKGQIIGKENKSVVVKGHGAVLTTRGRVREFLKKKEQGFPGGPVAKKCRGPGFDSWSGN